MSVRGLRASGAEEDIEIGPLCQVFINTKYIGMKIKANSKTLLVYRLIIL